MARLRQVALIALAALIGRGVAGPCDIYGGAGTPCVAAHSTVRALYAAGAQGGARLYQLKRQSDNATLDIHALADGFADTAVHEIFCAAAGPAPPSPVPGVGSTVVITSVALPALSFRHCYSQGFVTPSDGNADHAFKVVAALNGDATAVSFQSMNFPTQYVALVAGAEAGRLGIAPAPAASDASWTVAPATEGGVTLTLQGRGGLVMTVGGNLTGTCAHSYAAPDASVYAAPGASGAGAAWRLITSGYPALASCFIWRVYDQSPNGNDLPVAGPGINNPNDDLPVNATRHSITVGRGGRRAYGMWFETGQGYRAVNTSGVPRGNDPETLVMVTSGTHVNGKIVATGGGAITCNAAAASVVGEMRCVGRRLVVCVTRVALFPSDLCCFDYGNSENDPTNSSAFVDGAMESINFSTTDVSGTWCGGAGHVGPWVVRSVVAAVGLCGCAWL